MSILRQWAQSPVLNKCALILPVLHFVFCLELSFLILNGINFLNYVVYFSETILRRKVKGLINTYPPKNIAVKDVGGTASRQQCRLSFHAETQPFTGKNSWSNFWKLLESLGQHLVPVGHQRQSYKSQDPFSCRPGHLEVVEWIEAPCYKFWACHVPSFQENDSIRFIFNLFNYTNIARIRQNWVPRKTFVGVESYGKIWASLHSSKDALAIFFVSH